MTIVRRECKSCRGTGDHCHLGECTDPCDDCEGRGYHLWDVETEESWES